MTYSSYVALGDSFTEGLDDPGASGNFRGWADRVAERLATEVDGFRYANLAIRGRLLGPIVEEQVPAALRLSPQLVSLAGGTNDILRRNCDPPAVGRTFRAAVATLREAGMDVVVFTGTDPTRRLPSSRRLLPRIRLLNDAVRRTADLHGALLVDLWSERVFDDPRLWSVDRLHLSAEGHRRVAEAVLERLGVTPSFEWRAPLDAYRPPGWAAARGQDLRWAKEHLAPWVYRRLTGRSSGDTVVAKRPELAPYDV